jgi:hypothetical protein
MVETFDRIVRLTSARSIQELHYYEEAEARDRQLQEQLEALKELLFEDGTRDKARIEQLGEKLREAEEEIVKERALRGRAQTIARRTEAEVHHLRARLDRCQTAYEITAEEKDNALADSEDLKRQLSDACLRIADLEVRVSEDKSLCLSGYSARTATGRI